MLPGAQAPSRKPRLLRALPTVAGTALGLAAGAVTAAGRSGADRSGSSSGGGAGRAAGATRRAAGATKDLAEKSRQELYELARKAGVEGRSAMSKKELVRALSH